MRGAKNIIKSTLKTVPILLLIAFQSCATYNSKTSDIENNLFNGDFKQAIAGIDKNAFLLKDRNRLLYLMEKGKVEHLSGNYEGSNALLEQAYILIDDRIKTGAAHAVAAKFTNPMTEPYKGEDFEKVTIHYYKALNYFHLGMPNEALVEAKRINLKLHELNEKYTENKNKYSEDAFSQILQGILYESTGDINNAFIAYRNAEEIYAKDGGKFFGVPMPEQLKEDLLRTTRQLGFREEHEGYLKKFHPDESVMKSGKKVKKAETVPPMPPAPPTGEAIVFWENGLGPAKDQVIITASGKYGAFVGTYNDGEVAEEIIIPIPPGVDIGVINAIAIPRYKTRPSYYSKASIIVEGGEQPFELAQDFNSIARQCLKDRMLRETIDLVVRFATKKAASAGLGALGKELLGDAGGELIKMGADIAGAATEKADTRNWQTLPSTIAYTRLPLKEGENKFIIKKYGPQGVVDTDTLYIPYKRGLQIVNYFDLGRTQSAPSGTNVTVKNSGAANVASDANAGLTYKPAGPNVTVKSVLDKYFVAVGGEEKLKSIKTYYSRTITKSNFNGTTSSTETISKSNAKNELCVHTSADGIPVSTMVVNEKYGYVIGKDGKKNLMDEKTHHGLKNNKNIFMSSYQLDGTNLKLEGITSFNGHEVYGISYNPLGLKDTSVTNLYDSKTGLLVASATKMLMNGDKVNFIAYLSDYREVQGIKLPFITKTTGSGIDTETIASEIKINEGVSDADFQ